MNTIIDGVAVFVHMIQVQKMDLDFKEFFFIVDVAYAKILFSKNVTAGIIVFDFQIKGQLHNDTLAYLLWLSASAPWSSRME